MRQYLPESQAQEFLQRGPVLQYPYSIANLKEYPLIPTKHNPENNQSILTSEPDLLVVESMGHLGKEPKRIIDIGSAMGRNALYLAYQGHFVTALDKNKPDLDWAMDRARFLDIPKENFKVVHGDLSDMTADDKYEAVVSTMVVHFLEEPYALKALKAFSSMTTKNGLNIISAYTEDNPQQEIDKREVKYLFKGGELGRLYMNGWQRIRNAEGYRADYASRDYVAGEGMALIPTIAEIIARKTLQTSPRTYMNANHRIVTIEI